MSQKRSLSIQTSEGDYLS